MQHHSFIFHLLVLLCKVSVTVTLVGSTKRKKCFLTNKELRAAVKNYTSSSRTKKKATISKYGSPIGSWCVGKVKDFSLVFESRRSFNEPLTDWDTSQATTMYGMFVQAASFNQPLDRWNVSRVTDMNSMFYYADAFNQPLDSWNVNQVTDMSSMFENAKSFDQPLNRWNVSRVTRMSYMFFDASSFNQSVDNWNVSQVTNMYAMFSNAYSFNKPLDRWNVGRVTAMRYMFDGASSFNQPLNSWNVSQVTDMAGMFLNAANFNQALDSWNVSQVTDMNYMFYNALVFDQNLCSWGPQILPYCFVVNMFGETNCSMEGTGDPIVTSPYGPICQACKNSQVISSGSEKTGLFAYQRNQAWIFELKETVGAGHRLTCELEVPNGDANLFIKFGSFPEYAQDCDVSSTKFGPFDEDCTSAPANTNNTTAYITVQAAQESSDMALFCKIDDLYCLDLNQLCNKTEDCCGTRVCDGNETVAPRCVPCGKPEPCDISNPNCANTCTKPSGQCCRQYACDDGTCKKQS